MKKLNKKGFMLTETLIVATMLITILLVMYVQFKTVIRSYQQSFKYNTINNLYSLYNVKKYVEREKYNIMATRLNTASYVDLSDCSNLYFKDTAYCSQLLDSLNIKELYLVKENVKDVKSSNNFSSEFNDFLKTIKSDKTSEYRLIASFTDNTFGTLKVLNDKSYEDFISNSCLPNQEVNYSVYHKFITTNEDITNPSKLKTGCGTTLNTANFVYTNNNCYYPTNFSTNQLTLGLDESANYFTIYYDRYESNLTINYYEVGTTNVLAPSVTINAFCGYKLNIDQYKKTIGDREFVSATENDIVMTKNDKTVNIYYTAEGGSVYED